MYCVEWRAPAHRTEHFEHCWKKIPVQCSGYPNRWYEHIQKCTSIRLCDALYVSHAATARKRECDSWYSSLYCWHWCSHQFACHTHNTQCTGNALCFTRAREFPIWIETNSSIKSIGKPMPERGKTEKRNWTDIMHNLTIHSMHFDEIDWGRSRGERKTESEKIKLRNAMGTKIKSKLQVFNSKKNRRKNAHHFPARKLCASLQSIRVRIYCFVRCTAVIWSVDTSVSMQVESKKGHFCCFGLGLCF